MLPSINSLINDPPKKGLPFLNNRNDMNPRPHLLLEFKVEPSNYSGYSLPPITPQYQRSMSFSNPPAPGFQEEPYRASYLNENRPVQNPNYTHSSYWNGSSSFKNESLESKERRLQKEKDKRDQITNGITRLQKMIPDPNKSAKKEKHKRPTRSESSETSKRTSKATILIQSARYIKGLQNEADELKAKLEEYEKKGYFVDNSKRSRV